MRGILKTARTLVLTGLVLTAPARAEPVTVLALGDSLTQGYGLPTEAGFVPRLEAWLAAQGTDVTVINGGVSGDTTAGGAARLGWSLTDEVDAVIVALGGNDILRGIPASVAQANLAAILDQIAARALPVLLVGQRATANFGAAYQQEFDAIYPALAAQYDTALFPDFLEGLNSLPDRETVVAGYLQADGLHPNAEGVRLVVAAMGPAVLELITRTSAR
ncbi:arylesterase [Aliiroseovarius sp.]|uniref:arylesterase n=1 Tax=Aliiroseovarius sp. TaxID=1872442 RepID=UPI002606372E|nr:arylesterase [Aliiroseovarius sp.]